MATNVEKSQILIRPFPQYTMFVLPVKIQILQETECLHAVSFMKQSA